MSGPKASQSFDDRDLKQLTHWYERAQREFPWRKNPDPYWVWLAEIMSQQTQMAQLIPYFERFLGRFPTVQSLAQATESDVLAAWTGLGYYSRARNVLKAAQQICSELGGRFPNTFEGWLELPGVGPYTAAAVVSQCFGVSEPVWDGNVLRVSSRFLGESNPYQNEFRERVLTLLRDVMATHDASKVNQGLMELGATICTPRNPDCGRCPFQTHCLANKKNLQAVLPPPKPRKAVKEVHCSAWLVLRKNRHGEDEVFVEKREPGLWYSGMWDFPSEVGGVQMARRRRSDFIKGKAIGVVKHSITHHKISLKAHLSQGRMRSNANSRWISLDSIETLPLATTARKILKQYFRWRAQTRLLD